MPQSEPATIVYIAWAPFFSGAERALVVLLEHLDPKRYRPVVVVGTDGELAAELRSRQIQTIHLPIVYADWRKCLAWTSAVKRFAQLARREGASLFHANDLPSFQPAGYAARILRLPAITHVRFPDTTRGFEWFLKPGFQRALFVSNALRSEAVAEAPRLFESRSEVVYDGVNVPPEATVCERAQLRAELGLPADRTLVVMAGQVAEVKGLWDFIEAASLLASRGAPISFVVLGDDMRNQGALRIEAERVVRQRGLDETVKFLGFRPNAQRLIPAFDIVAVPSHIEPLGNATLEAMASARPVVGSKVGGIPEMVIDGITGTLIPSRDPQRLAGAIEALAGDHEKRQQLGQAGRRRALSEFSVAAHVSRVQSIYDRMRPRNGQGALP